MSFRRYSDGGASFGGLCSKLGKKKVCSTRGALNNLQNEFLREFFKRENRFYFRRLLVKRGDDAVVVDLVREYAFQLEREKREIGGIRIDSPEEILASKLCALLSRSEIRDLVDVRELERAGFDLVPSLFVAQQKDTGLTPGQLAWVLDQIELAMT